MTDSQGKRPFRVEMMMQRQRPDPLAAAAALPPLSPAEITQALIREEMARIVDGLRVEIRNDLERLLSEKLGGIPGGSRPTAAHGTASALPAAAPAAHPPAPAGEVMAGAGQLSAEEQLALLKAEIRGLSSTIERTKSEIASLYHTSKDNKRMDVMRDELGAIVKDTEAATGSILEAMETIDDTTQFIKSSTEKDDVRSAADQVLDQVIKVFEFCNFQDLTGQRINKVVNTLKHIEERVSNLVAIWSDEELTHFTPKEEVKGMDDLDKTLASTTAQQQKVSQADVDKYFS